MIGTASATCPRRSLHLTAPEPRVARCFPLPCRRRCCRYRHRRARYRRTARRAACPAKERKTYEIKEESRELTHEEIWDDSALIHARNAAAEEYEAYHGPDKGWKNEPVNKSPLWYNTPPSKPKSAQTQPKQVTFAESPQKPQKSSNLNGKHAVKSEDKEPDSAPIDFDTFVPSLDPSLDQSQGGGPSAEMLNYYTSLAELPSGQTVSQDGAFGRAMQAMYWGGYWTAVYHYQRKQEQDALLGAAAAEGEGDGVDEEEE